MFSGSVFQGKKCELRSIISLMLFKMIGKLLDSYL